MRIEAVPGVLEEIKVIGLGLYLLAVSIYDIKEKTIPILLLIFGGLLVGTKAVYGVAAGEMAWYQPLLGIIPGMGLLLVAWITEKMGYGDGLVLMLIGGTVGYQGSLVVLCFASFFAAILCVILLAIRKVKKHSRIPYVPFLAGSYLLYIGVFV